MIKMVKIEKLILKTKATDNLLLAPMERAPQSYPRKSVNSKTPKIELNSFTKPGPNLTLDTRFINLTRVESLFWCLDVLRVSVYLYNVKSYSHWIFQTGYFFSSSLIKQINAQDPRQNTRS